MRRLLLVLFFALSITIAGCNDLGGGVKSNDPGNKSNPTEGSGNHERGPNPPSEGSSP